MGAKVVIELEGLSTVLSNLERIEAQALSNLERQTVQLTRDAQDAWREKTPVRSGRLMGQEKGIPGGLEVEFINNVRYYPFVDEGHMTPAGWHTKHGYRPAKRRSHVEGKFMTNALVEFLEGNIEEYLSKFIDG
jgi:hypothetical protein